MNIPTGGELIIILIVALVVVGPDRLPEMARSAGRMINKVKSMTEGLQSEVRDVMDDPSMQPLKELGELAVRPRQKLTEYALEAEAEARAKQEAAAQAEADAADAAADAADAALATEEAGEDSANEPEHQPDSGIGSAAVSESDEDDVAADPTSPPPSAQGPA